MQHTNEHSSLTNTANYYLNTYLFFFFYFVRFFFNDTATTEIYTLSLHDALPISFIPIMHVFGLHLPPKV